MDEGLFAELLVESVCVKDRVQVCGENNDVKDFGRLL